MNKFFLEYPKSISSPRRRFVQGLVAGGVAAAWGPLAQAASMASETRSRLPVPVLSGNDIQMVIEEKAVNFTGNGRVATAINGSIPAPTLRLKEGQDVIIRVTNKLSVPTSIHWHGFVVPYQMDGVPGISYKGIAPGETFVYRFKVQQSGTYWYHSHSGFQEQTGMYGAVVIEPKHGDPIRTDRDYVVQLSDWTDEDPERVFEKLKIQSDYYNIIKPTAGSFVDDVEHSSLSSAVKKREMWNQMRMNPTDLADMSSMGYTFLMNGTTPAGNWTGLFKPGERVRLRFINGASNTFYDVRIPGLKMTVVQSDGTPVEPVSVDEFRFGPGETYDVLVQPRDEAHTIFAQTMDRTGYAKGTLAVREGLSAEVPPLDAVQWLSMSDMMGNMSMGGMSMGGMSMGGMSMGGMSMGGMSMGGMSMGGMSMGGMSHGDMPMDMKMDMQKHDMHMGHGGAMSNPLAKPSEAVHHASTEYGPSTDMRVNTPRTNLDDPGVGLRKNGRKVLTLADLSTIGGPLDKRLPSREIELHLTGNMERYTWSFDGLEFSKSTPVHFRHGERLRVILQNDTMMTHPMHMHGMWSELETDQGEFQVRRHTIPVQPAQRVSYLVTADALGRWAWHCHLAFHMHAGMFREIVVS
ncbi:copper resistance system multicopper oxidase [Limnobacter litoralis]|uniref:Copper oxidase n=1 Tax=Limnobacter litoralis TaxID=481366 RepID=A0ABQ5YM00_9BURK|nr:copper resistance system multicopper oxidase [Limnobacter litoralis]GLR25614.1 copper oxidase [Limnobacter litoralis]